MQWHRFRSIIQEPGVSQNIDAARKNWPRLDDAWAGLEWLLARKASTLGLAREEGGVLYRAYKQGGDSLASTPDILILFTCTDDQVIVHATRITPAPEPIL
jgi:hypothetical protein